MALNTVTYQANGVTVFGTPDAAVTAGTSLVSGAGVTNADPWAGGTQYEPNKVWSQIASGATARTTPAAAITNNVYTQWTVSRTGGMLPKQIRVKASRGAVGTSTRGFRIRWSVDNYATDLLGRDLALTAEESRPNLVQFPSAGDPLQGDLSAAPQQTAVTFRIYNYATNANNSLEFDDLELTYDTPGAVGDTTAPTVPGNVQAVANSATQVTVTWTASTDAVGVVSYRVRRDGADLAGAGAVTGTSFVDSTAAPSTTYSYTVSAVDAAGNRSAESTAAPATTPAAGGGTGAQWVRTSQSIGTYTSTQTKTSHTATYDAAPTAGNLLILQVEVDKTTTSAFTVPGGWTVIQNAPAVSLSQLVAWKIATASEAAPTVSWTQAQRCVVAAIHEFTGVDPANPIGSAVTWPYVDTDQTAAMTIDPPAATANGLAVACLGLDSTETADGSGFQPSAAGWTSRSAFQDTSSVNSPGLALLDRPVTAGENLAAQTFSWTTADQHQGVVFMVQGGAAAVTPTLVHRVLGIPSTTTARAAARTTDATSVRLQVSTSSTFASGIISGPAVTPNAQGDAQLTVTGLAAGTTYWHRIGMTPAGGGETFSAISSKSFKTAPAGAASFAFCFGSCTDATDSAAMAAIAARSDDLFFHLGDLYYADGTGTGLQNFRDKMVAKIQAPNHAAVFAGTPTSYTPSDHDGMLNNNNAGSNATGWTSWNTARSELFPPSVAGTPGAYDTWTWGRVRFIQIDRRSFASSPAATDNSSKTCLGTTQKQWLKDTITNAAEPVIVIVQESPWIGAASAGDDGWIGFTTERTELANFFAASGKPIVMLAGDMHAVAADNGTNAPGGIAVFHGAPLRQGASVKGGPYTQGPYPASGTTEVQQYGRVVVTDDGSSVSLAFTGYSSDNTARVTLTEMVVPPATAGLSGSGSLSAAPRPGWIKAAALAGSGALAAALGQTTGTQPAALSGAGNLTAGSKPGFVHAAALSGTGALTTTQRIAVSRTAALSGSGTLAAPTRPGWIKAAALSGSGQLLAETAGVAHALLSGAGSLTTAQQAALSRVAALSSTGTLTAAQFRMVAALAAALSGAGTLTVVTPSVPIGASLTGEGHLSTFVLNLLRIGSVTPSTIRVGGVMPSAIYLGTRLVWKP